MNFLSNSDTPVWRGGLRLVGDGHDGTSSAQRNWLGPTGVLEVLEELPAFVYEVRGYWEGTPKLTYMSSSTYLTGHDVSHWAEDYANITELIHPEDMPTFTDLRRRAQGGEAIARAEYRERTIDGSYIWVLDVVKRTHDPRGLTILAGFCMDITNRKQQEASLLERERRLRAVMETGAAQVLELDSQGRLVYMSPNSISGFPSSTFASDPLNLVSVVVEDDRDRVRHVLMDSIDRRTGCDVEFRVRHKDSSVRFNRLVLTYFAGELGAPGWVGVLSEITELKTTSRRARVAEQRARAVVQRAGAWVYLWRHSGATLRVSASRPAARMEVHPDDVNEFNAAHRQLAPTQGWREIDFRWRDDAACPWRWARATACGTGDDATVFGVFIPGDNSVTQQRERDRVQRKLSAREREVLQLLSRGSTNREIAQQLHLSERTAGHHVARVLGKLELPNRASAAALAARLFDANPD
jgi:PAS domain S-box-containing protein